MYVASKMAHIREKKIGLTTLSMYTKCLKQIEILDLLHMCAPGSKLPSYIDTINKTEENKNSEEGRKHILWQK